MNRLPLPGRWDPMLDLHHEMSRLFEAWEPRARARMPRPFPPLNLVDGGDHYEVTAEVPGMEPEGLDLSIAGETLTLRGERKRLEGVAEDTYRRQERPFGRWARTVNLPDRVDPAGATARFNRGILTVTLPKAEDAKPRQIAVMTNPA